MEGLECLEGAFDETLDMKACHIDYFEEQNNCTLPWRREMNPSHAAVCDNETQFESLRQFLGTINKMNVQEISKLTGCLQACGRTEYKSTALTQFVGYSSRFKFPRVRIGISLTTFCPRSKEDMISAHVHFAVRGPVL